MATKKVAAKKTVAKKTTVKKAAAKKTTKCASKCATKKAAVETKAKVETKVQEQNVNNNSYIVIDYPVEKETIFGDVYVEISFSDSEWKPCRFASGYWWFDWMYYKSGNYKIVARLIGKDGNVVKVSDVKSCKVS